jgi:hypothetical protein
MSIDYIFRSGFLRSICLMALFICGFSCKKHNETASIVCINRVMPAVNNFGVSGAALDSINQLFSANNLSTANLQFHSITTSAVVSPSFSGVQEQVLTTQYFNGLPVFQDDRFFIFNAGVYQSNYYSGGFTGTPPGPDTAARLSMTDLRTAFLNHVSESVLEGGAVNSVPRPPQGNFKDSCLNVTLGYLDAAIIPGYVGNYNVSLVRTWKITTANTSFPLVFVDDETGKAWGLVLSVP